MPQLSVFLLAAAQIVPGTLPNHIKGEVEAHVTGIAFCFLTKSESDPAEAQPCYTALGSTCRSGQMSSAPLQLQ